MSGFRLQAKFYPLVPTLSRLIEEGRLSSEVQHILEERLIRSEPTKAFAWSEVEQSTEGGEISLRDIVQGMAFRNKLPEQPVCVLDRRLFPGRMRMRKVDQYSEFLLHLLALNEIGRASCRERV